ncbi:MAG: nucleotide exchange factor GrpE, partial [Betaproteobacteria bacterium HGW-Betaproteobacteria-17]
ARFDPVDQDAVAIATPDDPALDDMVKATFQVGYRFRGTAIRPAKVQVWSVDGSL